MTDWGQIVSTLGIGGAMAAAMVYLVVWLVTMGIPKIISDFRDEMRLERLSRKDEHAAILAAVERQIEQTERLRELLEPLIRHLEKTTPTVAATASRKVS